jgi:hypothetical protein
MITINGYKFAESDEEFIDSLFTSSEGTCAGYAKRYKRHIHLYNMQKELIGDFVGWGVCTARHLRPSELPKGKKSGVRYSYGTLPMFENMDDIDFMNTNTRLRIGYDIKGSYYK